MSTYIKSEGTKCQSKLKSRSQVREMLNFLHTVNGEKFVQKESEVTKRVNCIVSVSFDLRYH